MLIGSEMTAANISNWYYYSALVVSWGFQGAEMNMESCSLCCACCASREPGVSGAVQ